MDHDACYRALSTRDARFDGRLFVGVEDDRHLLPADLPGAHAEARERALLSHRRGRAGGGLPALPALPAGDLARPRRLARRPPTPSSRALALIEAGALDDADVEALADRLGVGERQLRRLFRQHLGASPIAVAQTRRVLLAKQLIHETRPADGRGGAGRPASAASAASTRPSSSSTTARRRRCAARQRRRGRQRGEAVRLDPALPAALRLGRHARLPGRARHPRASRAVAAGRYARTIAHRRRSVGVLRSVRAVAKPTGCRSTVRFPKLSALPAIIARVRRVFDLAADPVAIGEHLARTRRWRRSSPRGRACGCPAPGTASSWRSAPSSASRSRSSPPAASPAKLVAAYGEPLPPRRSASRGPDPRLPNARRGWRTPTSPPRHAARAGRGADGPGRGRRRRPADVRAAARRWTEAIAALKALPGIGEWTAQYIAMRELREPDAFPAADIGLMRALADAAGRRPTPAELLARAEAWRPWRAYAALHLWASEAPRHAEQGDRPMTATPPDALLLDRLADPDRDRAPGRRRGRAPARLRLRGLRAAACARCCAGTTATSCWRRGAARRRRSARLRAPTSPATSARWTTCRGAPSARRSSARSGRRCTHIPAGETRSYGELAARIGEPNAVRAVGLANGAEPDRHRVPCHRVIGADGSLTGFGGGLPRKRWLLDHERVGLGRLI